MVLSTPPRLTTNSLWNRKVRTRASVGNSFLPLYSDIIEPVVGAMVGMLASALKNGYGVFVHPKYRIADWVMLNRSTLQRIVFSSSCGTILNYSAENVTV